MGKTRINFHSEDVPFSLKGRTLIRNWITEALRKEKKQPGEINYIFCSDDYLLQLNRSYLNHDTLTDIITFDYSGDRGQGTRDGGRGTSVKSQDLRAKSQESKRKNQDKKSSQLPTPNSQLSGDIFISIDRVKENAKKFEVSFDKELRRVMIHGALHLAGYKDKRKADKELMTRKEDFYLYLFEDQFKTKQ